MVIQDFFPAMAKYWQVLNRSVTYLLSIEVLGGLHGSMLMDSTFL